MKNEFDIDAWQITSENIQPSSYVELNKKINQNSGITINDNVNQNSTTNSIEISNTINASNSINTTVNNSIGVGQNILDINTNIVSQNNDSKFNKSNTYVAISASFDAGTTYYVWVRDLRGNVYSQSFRIEKVEF